MLHWARNLTRLSVYRIAHMLRGRPRGAVRLSPGAASLRGRSLRPLHPAPVFAALPEARGARKRTAVRTRGRIYGHCKSLLLALALLCSIWPIKTSFLNAASIMEISGVDRKTLAWALDKPFRQGDLPETLHLDLGKRQQPARIRYSLDPALQQAMHKLYAHYRPDYAAFVALDAESGEILCMVDYVRSGEALGNLVTRNTFPAASVMKVVTAAAAIDLGKLTPDSVVEYNGASTKLLKGQVLGHKKTKWTHRPTLERAFAQSINPVFGRIGVEMLGHGILREYTGRFGFNRSLQHDVPIPTGSIRIDADDWQVAQISSGYTRKTTLSPLHGAMVAAAIANNGRMPVPYIVNTAYDEDGLLLYVPGTAREQHRIISAAAAAEMRKLMRKTVQAGSASRSFNGFSKGPYAGVEVGGKTGTMSGTDPRGRNDWFVGYADFGDRKIAFASLNVNKKQWRVKSSLVARRFIEAFSDNKPAAGVQVADKEKT